MVREGKSNGEIYEYIARNYGNNQIAVPRNSWMKFVSMGLPYIVVGLILVIAVGFGQFWVQRRELRVKDSSSATQEVPDEKRRSIESMVENDEDNPLT